MAETLIIRGQRALSAPIPGAPVLQALHPVFTSDSFSGASAEAVGRVSDASMGGLPIRWSGTTGAAAAGDETLRRSGAANVVYAIGHIVPSADLQIGFRLLTLPTPGDVYIDFRRVSLAQGADGLQVFINASGVLTLRRRVGGAWTVLAQPPQVATPRADIAITATGDLLTLTLRGTTIATVTDSSITAPGYAGVSGAGDQSIAWSIADWQVITQ